MSESIITLWINSETNSLLPSWNSFGSATIPSIKQGDSAKIEIHWIKSDSSGNFMSEVVMSPTSTLKLAVGSISGVPTEGYFTYNYQGDTVQIPYDADVTSIPPANPVGYIEKNANTLINSLPSIIAAGGVVVSMVNQRTLRIVFNNFGVRALSSCDATTLRPSTNVSVTRINTGGATTKEVQHLRPKVLPIAYADSFSSSPSPVISITNIDSITKRISITPQPKFGTFTISNGTLTTSVLSINSSASDVLSALTSANINSSTRLYSVAKSGDYSWDIYRTSGTAETLTVTDSGMIGFESKFGVIDFNTVELEDYLGGAEKANATIEVEYSDGTIKQTLYQGTVSIVNDLIEDSVYSPIPFPELTAGMGEAPMDSVLYGRKDGIWSAVIGDGNNIPDYNNGITYTVGNQVYFQGKLYRMIIAVGGAGYDPVASPSYWESLSGSNPDLTNYLTKDGGSLNSGAQLDFDNSFGVSSIGPMGAGFYEVLGTKSVAIYNDRIEVANGVGNPTIVNTSGITFPDATVQTTAAVTSDLTNYLTKDGGGLNTGGGLQFTGSDFVSKVNISGDGCVAHNLGGGGIASLKYNVIEITGGGATPDVTRIFPTGITFPDGTTQATSALPLSGGTMTGQIISDVGDGYTSTLSNTGLSLVGVGESSYLDYTMVGFNTAGGASSLNSSQLYMTDTNTGNEIFVTANGLDTVGSITFQDATVQTTAYTGTLCLPLAGGVMDANAIIKLSETLTTATESEMAGTGLLVQLISDHTRGTTVKFDGLDVYRSLDPITTTHMLVTPQGLTFPDSTVQTTAATTPDLSGYAQLSGATFESIVVDSDGSPNYPFRVVQSASPNSGVMARSSGILVGEDPEHNIFGLHSYWTRDDIVFYQGNTGCSAGIYTHPTDPINQPPMLRMVETNGTNGTNVTEVKQGKIFYDGVELYAPIASPALTGVPTAPTPLASDNSTTIATTAYVTNAVASSTTSPSTQKVTKTVRNATAALIPKRSVVYINGANGTHTTISLAQANAESTSYRTFGVTESDIAINGDGVVVIIGEVLNVNTGSFADGDQLYLSPTIAGGITNVKPSAPNHMVYVGIVTRANNNNGKIEVNIANGFELHELHDVAINGKLDKDLVSYEQSTNLWKNKSAATLGIAELSGATFTGKVNTTQTTTTAPLNLGFLSTAPTTTVAGDLWVATNLQYRAFDGVSKIVANTNTQNTFSQPQVISPPSTATLPALRITNTSAAYSCVVEDETSPDPSAFIINNDGRVGILQNSSTWTPTTGVHLDVAGKGVFSTNATFAGLNIGSSTTDPTSTITGDIWIGTNTLNYRDSTNSHRTAANLNTVNTFSVAQVIQAPTSSALPALRISNSATTSGVHSLVVGDAVNPDTSSFVIDNNGNVGIGVDPATWSPNSKLELNGGIKFTVDSSVQTTAYTPSNVAITGGSINNITIDGGTY